jgi:hypothetical protein
LLAIRRNADADPDPDLDALSGGMDDASDLQGGGNYCKELLRRFYKYLLFSPASSIRI